MDMNGKTTENTEKLKIYTMRGCPHCAHALAFLKQHQIPYTEIDMEHTDPETEAKVIEVNGGYDWVVPTLEYAGKWRRGMVYEEESFSAGLKQLGIHVNPVSSL